jgi:putative flippase GtrA
VSSFLVVGGLGYVTDVAAFNILLSTAPFDRWDPSAARVVAVAVAMVVTYSGNRWLTWRGEGGPARAREVALFVVFNVIGLGISTLTLVVTHDLLGMTSRLDDNISANGIGLALGTLFRFWSYRRYVFAAGGRPVLDPVPVPVGSGSAPVRIR